MLNAGVFFGKMAPGTSGNRGVSRDGGVGFPSDYAHLCNIISQALLAVVSHKALRVRA